MVRRGLRLILEESRQIEVLAEAGDGQELVELADRHGPDVIVVDVKMPKLDGLEAVRASGTATPTSGP
jgi:YesN/AraC family two-component response regulator